ncbi:glutamyl-tRNA reductase [Ekhidna lutea]|uniref:Glutamyl-tRNA reductase n=1 Tax=Ekhidna lutea TaxID=447679 RepID=A0A239FLG0_EKHLU|nr:glutamyl-tRNA reductase [Ekhidna lutea]SNS57766.1 glutamyl-tRNA reductase [Ekhidna lutea]
MEGFKALGLSYKNAPIEVREQVAFSEAESAELLMKLKEMFSLEEALLVSTCNRTELYYSSNDIEDTDILALISSFKAIPSNKLANYFQSYSSAEASKHLFNVALGLESQVLGDIQISNQVKRAYQQCADLNLAGPHLHRLMHTIFYANKRVVQETRLQDGTASVASVAADLIGGFIDNINSPRIALIGLGEIGQNVLENLGGNKASITLVNRTKSKAIRLAEGTDIAVSDYSDLDKVIAENDVIISAVSTSSPIISSRNFDGGLVHKLLIDLSVPRSINNNVEVVPGLSLYNVDQLTERTHKARKAREKAIPAVRNIIEEELNNFTSWKNEMGVSPTIQRLKSALDQIRKDELARHKKLTDKEVELLEVVTKSMIQKVIKLPVLQLKAACKRGEAETLVGVLNDLFNLEAAEVEKK